MTAVIYARASTGEQTTSCDGQIRACTDKAKSLRMQIGLVFKDDGISGSRSDRPEYIRLLAAAGNKEFDTLFLMAQSRLGRDSMEVEKAIRRLEFHGVRIITCDGYDTNSASLKNRKLIRGVKGLIDEVYLEDLREWTHHGLTGQYIKGYWCGGKPYGYRLEEITDPKAQDAYGRPKRIGSRLVVDPGQAKVVVEIFERYAHGASPQSIASDLNQRGIPSPGSTWNRKTRRCKGWARSAIWQILRNPIYGGTYYWNRSQWTKTDTGRVRKLRTKAEIQGHEGNAPKLAIVKPATLKLVNLRLSVNLGKPKDKRLQSGGRAVYMLSGILKCSECGAHFVMDSKTHYRCGSVVDGKVCKNDIRVRRDVAERVILGPITEQLLSDAMVEEMAAEMRRYHAAKVATASADAAKRPAEVQELDRRIARLRDRLKAGDEDMTQDELWDVIAKAESKRAALLASAPDVKRTEKILHALPAAAKQYRDQIRKGLKGSRTEAGRARVAVRQLLGDEIRLVPAKGRTHLVAHLAFQKAALLGARSVGSGGRI